MVGSRSALVGVVLLFFLVGCRSPAPQTSPPTSADHARFEKRPIGEIRISTRNLYSEEEESQKPFYRLMNRLHWTTKSSVVRNRVWFSEGDLVSQDELDEVERILRRMGLFGEANVEFEPRADGGPDDVVIDAQDRLTLIARLGGSLVGGVSGFAALFGDRNLFGSGNELLATFRENSEDELNASLRFTDRYLGDSLVRWSAAVGRTEEGGQYSFDIGRPLLHLADESTWGLNANVVEDEVDFFRGGDSVIEVPRDSKSARFFQGYSTGPRYERTFYGVEARFEDTAYGAATGVDAATIEVPGDLTKVTLGGFFRQEWLQDFKRTAGVDAIDAIEDLALGTRFDLFAGAVHREEEGAETRVEPLASLALRTALEPADDWLVTLTARGTARWYAGTAEGWTASASLHAYQRSLDNQTLAASVTYDEVFENEDLPLRLSLGEDNGLRGYPAREFAGTKQLRCNFEDRIDTGLELYSLHIGVVPFCDVGWIGDDSFGRPLTSVGIGLRLGSTELLGRGVLRMDLALPLTDVPGEDYDPSISFALGQVFSFFGNASVLPTR